MDILPEVTGQSGEEYFIRLNYAGDIPIEEVDLAWRAGDVDQGQGSTWRRAKRRWEEKDHFRIQVSGQAARQVVEMFASRFSPLKSLKRDPMGLIWWQRYRLVDGPDGPELRPVDMEAKS